MTAADQTDTDAKPTHASACEEKFVSDLAKAIREWHEAGKPHKR